MTFSIRRPVHLATAAVLLAVTAAAWGCADAPTGGSASPATVHALVNNTTGSAVVFDEHNASLQVGYGVLIETRVTDAAGHLVGGARPTWTSTNPTVASVVTLPDSGFTSDGARASVAARAPGTAMIIAAFERSADTVHVTVEPGSGPSPNPPPSLTTFDLSARAVGFSGGADSSKWVFTPVAGAIVSFTQLPRLPGDTIAAAVTPVTVPTVIATATADANGIVSFHAMPAARFRLDVQTPAASVWASRTVDFYAPYLASMRVDVLLQKK